MNAWGRIVGRTARCLLAAAGLALGACGVTGPSRAVDLPFEPDPPSEEAGPYRIRPGDELEVRFFHTPEQNVVLPVRPDGLISLPLAYEVRAAGRTVEELRAELVQRCSRELASPEVAVIVRRFAPDQIHVGGEVGRPGLFELQAGRTVLQAVMQAGGFLPTASPEDVLIVRAAERGYRVIPVDLQDVLDGVDASGNMVLRPFDVVFVPSSPIANVNKWVDQYIRKNIPINISYRLDDLVDDDDD